MNFKKIKIPSECNDFCVRHTIYQIWLTYLLYILFSLIESYGGSSLVTLIAYSKIPIHLTFILYVSASDKLIDLIIFTLLHTIIIYTYTVVGIACVPSTILWNRQGSLLIRSSNPNPSSILTICWLKYLGLCLSPYKH